MTESPRIAAARAREAERLRRRARLVRPLIIVVFLAEALPVLSIDPRPAASGRGLPVLLALATAALAVAVLVARPHGPARDGGGGGRWILGASLVLAVAGNLLDALQGATGAVVGVSLVFWMVGANFEPSTGVPVALLAFVPACVITAVSLHSPAGPLVFFAVTAPLFYLIAWAGRRGRLDLARNELLVAELADLHDAAVDTAALAERGRIAREMHDVLAHSLSGLAIQLEAAALMSRREDVSENLTAAIGRARRLAHDGLDEARRAIDALRGERVPGPDALPRLIEDFGRDAEIEVSLAVRGERRPLAAEAALTVYRVTQEALTNIARHSQAQRASVVLSYAPAETRLIVEDHGDGRVPLGDVGAGYGISAMRERAALLDGTVSAAGTEDGFRVELVLPDRSGADGALPLQAGRNGGA